MAIELHTFDPEGDLLLVLSRPTTQNKPERETSNATPDSLNDHPPTDIASPNTPPEGENGHMLDIKVHLSVSSRHMKLASPVFRAMLQPEFKEGLELKSTGNVEIPLPEDDVSAFIVILNIIHNHHRLVPRKVDQELLLGIAVLVDKYQMLESIEYRVEQWIQDPELRKSIPEKYMNEKPPDQKVFAEALLRWLGISWVLRLPVEFKQLTRIALQWSEGKLGEETKLHLPIPDTVIENIEINRQHGIASVLKIIENSIARYQGADLVCTTNFELGFSGLNVTFKRRACDSMVLGSLIKVASELRLLPYSSPPYKDMSLSSTMRDGRMVGQLSRPLCNVFFAELVGSYAYHHGVEEVIESAINDLELSIEGLSLDLFI